MPTQNDRDIQRTRDQVQVLVGERGSKSQMAVRRGELLAIGSRRLLSAQVTAAPTVDQYNALQADVKALYDFLDTLSNRLG